MKKLVATLAVVALVLGLLVSFAGCKDKEFSVPENYAAIIQISINPVVNLYVDAGQKVLAVEYINEDARDCYAKIEDALLDTTLKTAVMLVVETAANKGYLAESNEIKVNVFDIKDISLQDAIYNAAHDGAKTAVDNNQLAAKVEMLLGGVAETSAIATSQTVTTTTEGYPTKPSRNYTTVKSTAPASNNTTAYAHKLPGDLAKHTKYIFTYAISEDEVIRQAITFTNTDYTVTYYSYRVDGTSQNKLEYNGVTYYESSSQSTGGTYTVTKDAVTLGGGLLVLTMNTSGNLVVKSFSEWDGVAVGNVFVKE